MDHFVLVYMLSTLHVPGMCYLIFLPVMHTRTAIQLLHRGSFSEHRWLSLSTVGGPHPFRACKCVTVTCAHESILFPHLERQGGNRPSCAERCRAPSHKPRSSSGRGGTAPSESAPGATRPAQVPQLERPRRAYPPVSAPQVRHGTWYPSQHVLLPGASFWLRPRARRTAGARSHTHTLRHPWACQCGTPVHLFHARLYLP